MSIGDGTDSKPNWKCGCGANPGEPHKLTTPCGTGVYSQILTALADKPLCRHCHKPKKEHHPGTGACELSFEPVTEISQPEKEVAGPYHEVDFNHPSECEFCMVGEDAAYYSMLLNKAILRERGSRDAEIESLVGALKEMDAIAYAVLDNFIVDSKKEDRWLKELKAEYAECHKALAQHEEKTN